MKVSRIPVALVILLVANTAFAQNVYRDYDTSADFSRYKTYAWMDRAAGGPSLAQNDDLERLMKAAVDRQLAARKLRRQTDKDFFPGEPDLLITYYAFDKDRRQPLSLEYDELQLNIASEIRRWQFAGNVVVDVIERESNRLVWRGVAPRAIYEPEKMEKKVTKAISRMFKGFPHSKRGYDPDYAGYKVASTILWAVAVVVGIISVIKR
ncbi:MAG: DUF4136 domain-containing protein [Blastocatellia bacterium]|nr:DUF4136 domain-containing protein [Blastocatellia bacterium]